VSGASGAVPTFGPNIALVFVYTSGAWINF
jgi:hypothetical protein